jgi:hypothetical protein
MNHAPTLLGLFAATLAACQDSAHCVEVSRAEVTDPQAAVLIGGTYGEVLATVVGERSGTLQWLQSEQYVSGFPPRGEAGITVTILEPSLSWDVDFERHGGLRYERLLCTDSLETELEVELKSDDGVLDASLRIPVTFQGSDAVTIVADVTDEDLGALDFAPVDDGASLLLTLRYGTLTDPEGSLRLRSATSDDAGTDAGTGAGMSVDLATWMLP